MLFRLENYIIVSVGEKPTLSGCSAVGSALGSGPRGRGFKSRHSDHFVKIRISQKGCRNRQPFCFTVRFDFRFAACRVCRSFTARRLRDLSPAYNLMLAWGAVTARRKIYKIKKHGILRLCAFPCFILLYMVFYLASVSSFVFSGSEEEGTTEDCPEEEGTTAAEGRSLFISALNALEENNITPTNITIARSANTKEL